MSKGSQKNKDLNPLVSLVITSYNRAHCISQAIESALEQDYSNIEVIVSDNCSSDNTDAVLKKYMSDARFHYSKNDTNIGMGANINKCFFELAKGDWIVHISSDDYLINKSFISKSIDLVNKYENVVIVAGKAPVLNTFKNKIIQYPNSTYLEEEFRQGKDVIFDYPPYMPGFGESLLSRKKMIETNNRFVENNRHGDLEMNLCLLIYGNVAFLNENTYMFTHHGNQESGKLSKSFEQNIAETITLFENVFYRYKKKYQNDEDLMRKWMEKNIKNYVGGKLSHLVVWDRSEYKLLSEYLKKSYPKLHKDIECQFKFFAKKYILFFLVKIPLLIFVINQYRKFRNYF